MVYKEKFYEMSMQDLNDDLTRIPLSGKDLIEIVTKLGGKKSEIGWITYSELNNVSNINQLFDQPIKCIFILIQPEGESVGHWILLAKNSHGLVYYDPYALTVEIDASIAMNNRLPKLLNNLKVDVNKHKHQQFGKDKHGDVINTCGRHTAVRCFFYWMTNDEYNKKIIQPLIRNGEVNDGDTIVNLLTGFLSDSDMVVETFLMDKGKDPLDIPIPGKERFGGSRLPHVRTLLRSRGGILFD